MPDADLNDLVRSVVVAEMGSACRVVRIDPLQVSARSTVVRVEVTGAPGHLVLTLTDAHPGRTGAPVAAGAGTDHERTAAVVALARTAGVPVPQVLAARTAAGPGETGYLLREHVDGTEWQHVRPLLDADAVRSVHRQVAETLLAIRTVPLDSFGDLDRQGRPAGLSVLEALHRRTDRRVEGAAARALLHTLLDRDAAWFTGARPALVHDDLHHRNVVLRQAGGRWRVSAVLDWEKAWAGPAEVDVARMAFWDDMTGPGFWEVYRAAVPEDDRCARRALLHQLAWCLEYDARTARHDRDTAAVCAALGVDPPSGPRGG